jgi:uridine kinase
MRDRYFGHMKKDIRRDVLLQLSAALAAVKTRHTLRVAIDGRSGAGKTTFADELAGAFIETGRRVIRTSIDGFHRPKAERYTRGRYSAEGYYYDARDLGAVRRLLLDPLGPNGDGLYRTQSLDLEADTPVDQPPRIAAPGSILLVDGTFLLRPELTEGWDIAVLLDTSEAISASRGIARDADLLGGLQTAQQLYARRYRPAYKLYERACRPHETADAIINNEDIRSPSLWMRPNGKLTG